MLSAERLIIAMIKIKFDLMRFKTIDDVDQTVANRQFLELSYVNCFLEEVRENIFPAMLSNIVISLYLLMYYVNDDYIIEVKN